MDWLGGGRADCGETATAAELDPGANEKPGGGGTPDLRDDGTAALDTNGRGIFDPDTGR